jgi:steroid 5-alpha reductase family enzyme
MTHPAATLLTLGAATVALIMFALWAIHLRLRNAGVVDIGWAASLGILAVLYGTLGTAPLIPRCILTAMAAIWSARLSAHLAKRVLGHPEEGRYQQLRQQWHTHTGLKFLLFFEAQALLDLLLSLPFLLVCIGDPSPTLSITQFAAIAIWLIAILGESIADAQLARFKRTAAPKAVCNLGLWNYSRHPNYFFEWLTWTAFALFATTVPHGWLAWSSPILMLFFLLKITGIPATEAQSLRSKGQAYAEYQRTTSAFVPWLKKHS